MEIAPTRHTAEDDAGLAEQISDRLSTEIVVALIGPVGSGVSTAAQFIQEILIQKFGYSVPDIIKPSDVIRSEAFRIGAPVSKSVGESGYIDSMQSAGNKLRERFGGNYLAEKTIERIYKLRNSLGALRKDGLIVPKRIAYVIDSLKNPDELKLLRDIYRDSLCVFGVFAPDDMRRQRLRDMGIPEGEVGVILKRDSGEPLTFGQKTRKIFVESDFFICNDMKKDELRRKIERFLEVSFNVSVHTPTKVESAMYEASAAAARSACMSRQVGAAIVSSSGELISVGWNDVPRFGGSLYTEDDQHSVAPKVGIVDKDNRCFKWGGCICHNETRRRAIVEDLEGKIVRSGLLKEGVDVTAVKGLLQGTAVDSLIEFSRSIHAEMEAILSVAREGRHSLVGATLHTTTYPCHNCARHIVAAGIKSVIYIEPYDKSLAVALHSDAITEDPTDEEKVVFRQYDGVAPRNFLRLFRPSAERKAAGKAVNHEPKTSLPVFRVPLDAFTEYEAKVIADLERKEQNAVAGPHAIGAKDA